MPPQLPITGPITLTLITTRSPVPTDTPIPPVESTTELPPPTIPSTSSEPTPSATTPVAPPAENSTVPTPSITVSDEPVGTALQGTGALNESSLSRGAVAGIVVVVVLVLAVSALLLVRVFYKKSRARRSNNGLESASPSQRDWFNFHGAANDGGSGLTTVVPPTMQQTTAPIFPSRSHQQKQVPIQPFVSPSAKSPGVSSAMGPLPERATTASYSQPGNGTPATVLKTYVPNLPDELAILSGDRVIVIESFDDGWAQVRRSGSTAATDKGVVPLECLELDSASIIQSGYSARGSVMSSRF